MTSVQFSGAETRGNGGRTSIAYSRQFSVTDLRVFEVGCSYWLMDKLVGRAGRGID